MVCMIQCIQVNTNTAWQHFKVIITQSDATQSCCGGSGGGGSGTTDRRGRRRKLHLIAFQKSAYLFLLFLCGVRVTSGLNLTDAYSCSTLRSSRPKYSSSSRSRRIRSLSLSLSFLSSSCCQADPHKAATTTPRRPRLLLYCTNCNNKKLHHYGIGVIGY